MPNYSEKIRLEKARLNLTVESMRDATGLSLGSICDITQGKVGIDKATYQRIVADMAAARSINVPA